MLERVRGQMTKINKLYLFHRPTATQPLHDLYGFSDNHLYYFVWVYFSCLVLFFKSWMWQCMHVLCTANVSNWCVWIFSSHLRLSSSVHWLRRSITCITLYCHTTHCKGLLTNSTSTTRVLTRKGGNGKYVFINSAKRMKTQKFGLIDNNYVKQLQQSAAWNRVLQEKTDTHRHGGRDAAVKPPLASPQPYSLRFAFKKQEKPEWLQRGRHPSFQHGRHRVCMNTAAGPSFPCKDTTTKGWSNSDVTVLSKCWKFHGK